MSAKFTFQGLAGVLAVLSDAGQIAATAARPTVQQTADAFAAAAREATPVGATGNLRRGVGVREDRTSSAVVAFQVKNTAPHAHLIELGWMHKNGEHMPGKFTFARLAPRFRQQMVTALEDQVPDALQRAMNR